MSCLVIEKQKQLKSHQQLPLSPYSAHPVIPEKQHVIRIKPVDDPALLLQGQHTDMQLSRVEEVENQLDHLRLLDVDGLLCRHDWDLAVKR